MENKFAKGSIEFLTVAVEVCRYIESDKEDKESFVKMMQKLLPLVYMKAEMVELREAVYEDDMLEQTVEEFEYEVVKDGVAELLGEDDQYLTAVHPDIAYSDTTIAAFISEDIADVYQMLKEFVNRAKSADEDIMNDALIACIEDFREYWGAKLLNALLALHLIKGDS